MNDKSDHSSDIAEDWVKNAKEFGDKCQAIQRDGKLSMDQKLEKQNALSKELSMRIQKDSHLKPEEKKEMVDSLKKYNEDWLKMHNLLKGFPK